MSATRVSLLFSFAEKYLLLLLSLAGGTFISPRLTAARSEIYPVAAVVLGLARVLRDFGAGVLLWLVGIVLVRHRPIDEINLARRKLAGRVVALKY
jgi:hypothetical protein